MPSNPMNKYKVFIQCLLIVITTSFIYPSSADIIQDASLHAAPPYVWMDRCDKEIGATVPAFNCVDDAIGVVAPKKVVNGKCEKPEDLNTRCVHMSRVGRLKSGNPDVDIIFSCRKDPSSLHKDDKGDLFWDIAVIQSNRKNGKTCFYQYLDEGGKDAKKGAPKSNSKEGKEFWNLRVDFCTGCHTHGPFVRSPHYYKEVKDSSGTRYVPEKDIFTEPRPFKVIHDHFPVYNVDATDNACTTCHNVGAFFALGQLHLGEVNNLAAGAVKSLRKADHPSPTPSGYNRFMTLKGYVHDNARAIAAVKALEECFAGQTKATIDESKFPKGKGCKITPVSSYKSPLPCLTRECEEIQR